MIRVALYEDSRHLRETYELLLKSTADIVCVGVYANCNYLQRNLKTYPADIVLMDIEMPGISGIEATRIIKTAAPETIVLMQTVFFDDANVYNAICAGASGYILKSTSLTGYTDAIREAYHGGAPMTPGIARRVLEMFKSGWKCETQSNPYELTRQEQNVLQLLVEGNSYKMIAAQLQIANDTVKTHIGHVYAKLHVHSGTEAVALAIREKLV